MSETAEIVAAAVELPTIVDDPTPLEKAREQAAESGGNFTPLPIRTDSGKVFTIPDPNLLDDDQQELFDTLRHEANQCDRWPDIEVPEEVVTGPDGTTVRTAAHVERGDFIQPYQKDGIRMAPSYNIRLAKIFLGSEARYEEFKAAGGRSNEIAIALAERSREQQKRQERDSKSSAGPARHQAVSDADRG